MTMAEHRILVTGARGFVGQVLQVQAERHPSSSSICLLPLEERDGTAIDVRDRERVAAVVADLRPTAAIHLAAIASPREAADDPAVAWSVNVLGTLHVADALRRSAPEARFILAGSSEAYGQSFADISGPLRENAALAPLTPYGATKAAADIMLGQMARQGLAATRFRPFNHTGAGQAPSYVVASFARQIIRIERGWQEPVIRVGDLEVQRDFLDVRDVADAYLAAALSNDGRAVDAFNLSTGLPVAIGSILRKLLALSPAQVRVEQDSSLLRSNQLLVASGDPGRASNVFGWTPKIHLETTLGDVLDHWRRLAESAPERVGFP